MALSVDDWPVDGQIEDLLKGISMLGGNLDGVNYQLRKAEIRVQQEQIKVARRANELNELLLRSNEQASKENEQSAKLMYNATVQLAKSTQSLNRATWVLVAFTAIQAIIAGVALYISLHPHQ